MYVDTSSEVNVKKGGVHKQRRPPRSDGRNSIHACIGKVVQRGIENTVKIADVVHGQHRKLKIINTSTS